MLINTPHVLLVEDNKVALHFLQTLVQQAGLTFTSALDGESALGLTQSHAFDLVITDIGLPGISGYELAIAIRHLEKLQNKLPLPIIGLTALDLHEAQQKCLDSGMNTVLNKPIHITTIHDVVEQYLIHPKNNGQMR